MNNVIQGSGFTIKESKFDFFFGRVTSSPRNLQRSLDNLENLEKLGIREESDGKERLMQIFSEGLTAPEILEDRQITEYGTNISRKVEVSGGEKAGAIVVRYFYPNNDLSEIPQITSILVLIYKQED
ncbi:MAG: hypothetical protein F6K35_01165 [Okeania sp. SIO2H7]|nr:hypothetical protein [Okeania sp. SIO2H7]